MLIPLSLSGYICSLGTVTPSIRLPVMKNKTEHVQSNRSPVISGLQNATKIFKKISFINKIFRFELIGSYLTSVAHL